MSNVLEKVRKALGRNATPKGVPLPPAIDEKITRLVYTDIGLSELFAKRAAEMKMVVEFAYPDDLADNIGDFLREHKCKRVMLSSGGLLADLKLEEALTRQGFSVRSWADVSLDESYDYDAAVTDVDYAVAETGTLVIRPTAAHGRALTLVPMYHIAVVQPKNMLADLVDLFTKLATEKSRSNVAMISGPSKTADIEMNVVTGVHGPNVVKAFLLK